MCGISGFFNYRNIEVSEDLLIKFGKLLHHRGPDNFDYFYDGNIGLAHNRLSILDLSEQGNQPFKDERFVLIFNGEIYNYLQLKKQYLDIESIPFHSTSDTEVLFHLLRLKGVKETLSLIKGMFAFAWFDQKEQQLFLCRDRIGIKPLFYGRDRDGTLFFASEMKAIQAAMGLIIDPIKALFSTAGILDKSRDYSIFSNIRHLQPGHYLEYSSNSLQEHPYFKLTDLTDPALSQRLRRASKDSVVEEFRGILRQSVESMLMSDAPMGVFVSGGIDSSLIAAEASAFQKLQLFTANVVGKYSEVDDARYLARKIGCLLNEYEFQPEYFLRDFVHCTWHMEVPIVVHTNAVPFSGVALLARQKGIKPVLTGEGSDELFLGYPRLLTRRFDGLIKAPFNLLNWLYKRMPALSRYALKETDNQLLGSFEQLSQKFQRQTLREAELPFLQHVPKTERADQYLSFQMINEGIVALLWRNDRMGMIASIESRFPFLDEEVVKFALNLPVKYKIGRTNQLYNYKHPFLVDKYIVREASRKYLDKKLVYKKKNGFPMYGFSFLKIDKKLFQAGFLKELLQLNTQQIDYFSSHTPPYLLAKFMALEIWARLFIFQEEVENVQEFLLQFCKVKTV